MNDIVVQKASINPEALDADLRTALGAAVSGISYNGGKVVVHMDDSATPTQVQQAQQIVGSHDANRLTAAQQAAVTRQEALAQLRETADAITLKPADFSGAQQGLAQKVMWLEQEVRELRQRLVGS
jgi:hypothetical protein